MRSKLIYLSLLLVAQLGLAFALGLGSNSLTAFDPSEKLLTFENGSPDRLVFEGSDHRQIVLQQQDGEWSLPEHYGAPADGQKIADLLQTLRELKRPWPVAENSRADQRFKVADDDFERRLTLFAGDQELARLLIGSSPGFRKVHARLGGEKTVYDIPFSSYQLSLKPEDWVDKGQLRLKPEEISSIALADCRLVREDKQLIVAGLGDAEQTAAPKVSELLAKLANLRILDVLARPQPSADAAEASLSVTLADGRKRSYQFSQGADPKELQLQVSDQPWLYKVAPGLQDELAAYKRRLLVQSQAAEQTAANTASSALK